MCSILAHSLSSIAWARDYGTLALDTPSAKTMRTAVSCLCPASLNKPALLFFLDPAMAPRNSRHKQFTLQAPKPCAFRCLAYACVSEQSPPPFILQKKGLD